MLFFFFLANACHDTKNARETYVFVNKDRRFVRFDRIPDKRDETNRQTFLHLLRLSDSLPCWRPIDRSNFPFDRLIFVFNVYTLVTRRFFIDQSRDQSIYRSIRLARDTFSADLLIIWHSYARSSASARNQTCVSCRIGYLRA